MKNYIYIDLDNIVRQIIPEYDEQFPDTPIQKRYSLNFLNNCVIRDAIETPKVNSIYDRENDIFLEPQVIEATVNISNIKAQKVDEMRFLSGYKIINEFYSNCKGELKRYDCEVYDQTNIQGAVLTAMLILNGLSDETLMYKNSDQLVCELYTPPEMIQLGIDLKKHVEQTIHKFDLLRQYILDKNRTVEELNTLTWDSEI